LNFPSYNEKQSIVNKALQDYFPENAYPQVLYEAMKYSIFSGGKRLRSVLCLFSYELFDSRFEMAIPSALALEFIHTYSLIHDDLPAIDNDDLRRGKPTCHKKFGEDVAILAGDSLFAEAFMVIAKEQSGTSEQVKKVLTELAESTGANGMVGGQVVDVISAAKDIDETTLNYIHANKTGKLIKVSALIGAILGEASEEEIGIVSSYAKNLGLSFQITDDILDLTKSTKELGKPANSDTRLKKATYPSILGLEKAKEKAIEHRDRAIDIISKLDKKQNLQKLAYYVTERSN
jgi:geranylgeranyl diphosphate synthase type II